MNCIELTVEEKALLGRIDFAPASPEKHDPEHWNAVGEAALVLMKSLIARKAIPDVRSKYSTDPDFNVGGRGRSRAEIFQKNGTRGEAIFRHPPFSEIPALLRVRAGLAASGDRSVPEAACGHGASQSTLFRSARSQDSSPQLTRLRGVDS
jgi:hypothetical protein